MPPRVLPPRPDSQATSPPLHPAVPSRVTGRPEPHRGSFVARYQAGEFDDLYGVPAGALQAGLARSGRVPHDELADALDAQAAARGDAAAQRDAIERLRKPGARVVVAGQQAGLLLGPTYSLSKAITAIQLARRHDSEERPVIPVFWVASQDHDAAEIDHAHLLDRSERLHRVSLPFPGGVPAGRTALEPGWFDSLRDQLSELDVPREHLDEVLELSRSAWEGAEDVGDLFARTLSILLGGDGLVVLDPMRPRLARLFRSVLEKELEDPRAGPEAINAAGEALKARGERPQLGRGQDATNLFLQDPSGPRRALRVAGRVFHPDGQPERHLRAGELVALLDDDPLALTPAAGLRPIVQDALLPTAAVVVGPGELRYFAQLAGVYRQHGVDMPLVWPRATVTLLEPPAARILARHDLTVDEFVRDPDDASRTRFLRLHGHAERFERARVRLEEEVEALLDHVDGIDPTLAGPVRRGRDVLEETVARLRTKTADAVARRDEVTSRQFDRLRAHLLPNGTPQERVLSPFSFFLKFGVEAVMDRLRTLQPDADQVVRIDPP